MKEQKAKKSKETLKEGNRDWDHHNKYQDL